MQSADQVSQVAVTQIVKCLPSDDVDVDAAVFFFFFFFFFFCFSVERTLQA